MRRVPAFTTSLAAGLAITAALGALSALGALTPAKRFAADALTRVTLHYAPLPDPAEPDVALVAHRSAEPARIPELALAAAHSTRDAIERLDDAGARAIAFDIDLSAPRDARDDAVLAEAIARSGHVVLATFRQLQPLPGGGELEVANVPIPALAEPRRCARQRADAGRQPTASCASRRAAARSAAASSRHWPVPRSRRHGMRLRRARRQTGCDRLPAQRRHSPDSDRRRDRGPLRPRTGRAVAPC